MRDKRQSPREHLEAIGELLDIEEELGALLDAIERADNAGRSRELRGLIRARIRASKVKDTLCNRLQAEGVDLSSRPWCQVMVNP